MTARVAVIDDDEAVLHSLLRVLEEAGYAAEGYPSAARFLDAAPALAPSVILTDVRMPEVDGLDLIRRLPDLGLGHWPLVVMSGHADVPMTVEAMRHGAVDVLEKPFTPSGLLAVVAACAARLAALDDPDGRAERARYAALTDREREVTDRLIAGDSSKSAGAALGISPRTVDVFRAKILRKMQVANVPALATLVARLRLG